MTHKTLKNKADTLFSLWIRKKGYCEWCLNRNANQYHCSHIFSRRYLVTRWYPLNANCLCARCHRKWHDKPVEAVEWIREYLGDVVYEELRRIAKTKVQKQDLEQIINDIKNERGLYVRND
jgi:hypothetical protein